jgi:1,4-dihydroxy-2-naphthoate octaprenyltransferase
MITVEFPDMEGDKKAKKRTLVSKIGRRNSYKIIILSLLFVSVYFLIFSYFKPFDNYINFLIIYFLSFIPLFTAVYGWFKEPFSKKKATKISQNNMFALVFFILLINIYLVIISFIM